MGCVGSIRVVTNDPVEVAGNTGDVFCPIDGAAVDGVSGLSEGLLVDGRSDFLLRRPKACDIKTGIKSECGACRPSSSPSAPLLPEDASEPDPQESMK